jgi:hypothetical protein
VRRILSFVAGCVAVLLCGHSSAQSERDERREDGNKGVVAGPNESKSPEWTAERMRNAKPQPVSSADPKKAK